MGSRGWSIIGCLGILTGFVILGFYSVIAGRTITSFFSCLKWSSAGYTSPSDDAFGKSIGNWPLQLLLAVIFMSATTIIIWKGIKNGIEKTAKILMPVLFAILIYLVFMVLFMPGKGEAFAFLFNPGFAELPWEGVSRPSVTPFHPLPGHGSNDNMRLLL